MSEIGGAIRTVRSMRSMTQAEVAKASRLSVSYIGSIERGERDPRFSTLLRISDAMNTNVALLVFMSQVHQKNLSPFAPLVVGEIWRTADAIEA